MSSSHNTIHIQLSTTFPFRWEMVLSRLLSSHKIKCLVTFQNDTEKKREWEKQRMCGYHRWIHEFAVIIRSFLLFRVTRKKKVIKCHLRVDWTLIFDPFFLPFRLFYAILTINDPLFCLCYCCVCIMIVFSMILQVNPKWVFREMN